MSKPNCERYTPPEIVELINDVFGHVIDCDPCSSAKANNIVNAKVFFDEQRNGLRQQWRGNVFVNPPYSEMETWIDKLLFELAVGRTKQAILLSNACTDTDWFKRLNENYLIYQPTFNFFDKRIAFLDGNSEELKPLKNPNRPSMFTYIGEDNSRFMEVFKDKGTFLVSPFSKELKKCA